MGVGASRAGASGEASWAGRARLREQAVRAGERKRWAGAWGQAPGKEWRARDATGLSAWRESWARCLRREWERLCARAGPERVRRDAGWSWAELALQAEWR